MRWIPGVLLVALLLVVSCGETPPPSEWSPAGFSQVSPHGSHALLTGSTNVDGVKVTVYQLAQVESFAPLSYQPVLTLEPSTIAAGFFSDGIMWLADTSGGGLSIGLLSLVPDVTIDTALIASGQIPAISESLPTSLSYDCFYKLLVGEQSGKVVLSRVVDGALTGFEPIASGASPTVLDDGRIAFLQLHMYDESQSRNWQAYLNVFDPASSRLDTLFQFESSYGVVKDYPATGELYFLSSQPDQKAGNVWKFSPLDSSFTQVTHLTEPEYVSSFHLIGDTLQYLVRDRTRESGLQCQYRSLEL